MVLIEAVPTLHRVTIGADRAYDTGGFVADLRAINAPPNAAQNFASRASRTNYRTVCHPGYRASQRARIEEAFAGVRTIALQPQTRFSGTELVGWASRSRLRPTT
jgi:hypothetical protein